MTSPVGMGWFPGYAIDTQTGERLNMAFGEDSGIAADNGKDMRWNRLQASIMLEDNIGCMCLKMAQPIHHQTIACRP